MMPDWRLKNHIWQMWGGLNAIALGQNGVKKAMDVFDRAKQAAQTDDVRAAREDTIRGEANSAAIRAGAADWFSRMSVKPVPITTGMGSGEDTTFLTACWNIDGRYFRGEMLFDNNWYGALIVKVKGPAVWCSYPKGRCRNCPHDSWYPANSLIELGKTLQAWKQPRIQRESMMRQLEPDELSRQLHLS